MSKYIFPIIFLLFSISGLAQNNIVSYEYWFDDDFANRVITSVSPVQVLDLNQSIPTTSLQTGLHVFHIRFKDQNGLYSSAISQHFYKHESNYYEENNIVAFEYWFDNNFVAKTSQSVTPQTTLNLLSDIDLSAVTNGLHVFHIRFKDSKNLWSSTISQHFYKHESNYYEENNIVAYEYWFDNNYAAKTSQSVTPQTTLNLLSDIDLSAVTNGLHIFHIRFKDSKNLWSSTISQHFYKSEFPSGIANYIDGYRYWVDRDTSTLTTIDIPVTTNPRVIIDNLDMTEIDTGFHIVTMQFRDLHDLWSSPVSDTFYRANQEPVDLAEFAIRNHGNQLIVNDPIQLGTGTYTYNHTDFKIPVINNKLDFSRSYNSINHDRPGPIGYGWSHSYDFYIIDQDTAWIAKYPDGHFAKFIPMNNQAGSFPVYSGTLDSLYKNPDDSYSLYNRERMHYHFDTAGKLDSIFDLNGNVTILHYSGNDLDSIVGPGGRALRFTHAYNKILTVQDPLNRTIRYHYDENENLVSVTDAENHTTNFTYDSNHRLVSVINALGDDVITNSYNAEGKVILQKDAYQEESLIEYETPNPGDATVTFPNSAQIIAHHDEYIRKTHETDELGFTKQFSYDSNSNETGYKNENDQVVTRVFDNHGNMLSDTLPENKITHVAYNSFNSPVQITDANGNHKFLYYNSINNNLDSIRFPDNSLNTFQYDNLGQLILMIDGNGDSTQYAYSDFGDVLSITAFNGIRQFTYDDAGRKISSTDENGHISYFTYDDNDNVLVITDPLNRTVEYTYDPDNQLLGIQDKKGFTTSYVYDKKGRKTSETNPEGGITTYTYDSMDNLISKTDPAGNVISYTYDLKNRKISMTNALGTTQYQYDPVGNLIKIIDPENVAVEYTYTGTNRKASQKDGLGNTTRFSYDKNDNLVSVTDPKNRVTMYGYDAMDRLITVTDALNNITSVTYDYNGNKTSLTDPNGHMQQNAYDAGSRLINATDASGDEMVFEYDSTGNITGITKPTGTITKEYDSADRVINIINSSGDHYTFEYDDNDNITSMSNSTGTSVMTYDNLNNLIQYQDPYGKTVSFEYDNMGRRSSITYPGNKSVIYTYDDANNLSTVTDWLNQTFTYTYDEAGRNTQLTYPNGTSCKYEYDQAGRLISRIYYSADDKIISGNYFTLDEIGNRISDQVIGEMPSVIASTSRRYSYEADDRMLSDSIWTFSNDNAGNRTGETNGSVSASYTFSVDNLLTGLTDTSGTNHSYSYNPLGHRLSKTDGTLSTRYVLDISTGLSKVLQMTDENGTLISDYVYGLGLLEKIDASGNPVFYHFDAQHNTSFLTDQSAATTDTYIYDPFGTLLTHTGASEQSFTFLGEFGVEQESQGSYYVRARYYDPVNGRFLSKDTYDYDLNDPQSINRYVYSINNPILIFDYTGLCGEQDFSFDNNTNLFWNTVNRVLDNKPLNIFFTTIDHIDYLNKFIGFYNGKVRLWSKNFNGSQHVSSSLVSTQKQISSGLHDASTIINVVGKGINLGLVIHKYNSGQINEQQVFRELYPDVAELVGDHFFGPLGGLAASYAAEASVIVGEEIGNAFVKTSTGDAFTTWLARKLYQY